MSAAYFKFLFSTTIKKKPVWITSIIFLFVVSCFLIIIPGIARINTLQLWANTTMIVSQSLIGIIGALLTAVLAINIFQDGKDEGTDLVISSKPMLRKHVVFSKFLVFGLICLIVNLLSVLITVFTIFLPRTEIKYYWGLLLSLFIGNTVSFAVFGSIASLLATKVNKTGVIVINLLIPLVLLIYQLLGLFVIPSPTKTAITNGSPVTSYTILKRDDQTGNYQEQNFAGFEFTSGFQQYTQCEISNWKDVQNYWTQVCNSTPTTWLNATEISSQIGSTYLSIDIDNYSDRYSQRIFGSSSRFYDYVLTSPISPEIVSGVENKQSVDFLYDLLDGTEPNVFDVPSVVQIYQPARIYLPAIKFHSSSALRGFTDLIPVGQIKSKEFNSSHDVYFEANEWNKYKKSFEEMYHNVFRYDLKDINGNDYFDKSDIVDSIKYYQIPFYTNENIKKVFDLIWACFTNNVNKYVSNWSFEPENLEINSVKDLNERLIQFKHFVLYRATQDQNNYIKNGYVSPVFSELEQSAKDLTILTESQFYSYCNVKNDEKSWFMTYNKKANGIDYIEPNTQTVSSQWLNDSWKAEKTSEEFEALTADQQIQAATTSAKFKIEQCGYLASRFSKVDEKYLYSTFDSPIRTSDNNGEIFSTSMDWIPYVASQALRFLKPAGHNFQYFFYTTTRKYNFWMFAIIWSGISICLFTTAIIIYNKHDIK